MHRRRIPCNFLDCRKDLFCCFVELFLGFAVFVVGEVVEGEVTFAAFVDHTTEDVILEICAYGSGFDDAVYAGFLEDGRVTYS